MTRPRILLPVLLVFLMCTSTAAAGISNWIGPVSLSGNSQDIDSVWEVPGNAPVLDAWLNIGEDGMTSAGNGTGWHAQDVPGNFTAGSSDGTTISHFVNHLSLQPNQSVSQVDQFSSASYQFPMGWTDPSGVWEVGEFTNISGSVSMNTRTVAHGEIPASAHSGSIFAGTDPGTALPANTNISLVSPPTNIPSPVSSFSFSFNHWYHLNTSSNTNGDGDGAWLEYRLDNGTWTWIEPQGGYPNTISPSAPVPNGASQVSGGHGFPVFASTSASGSDFANFTLDNVSGITNANQITFRFRVWTQAHGVQRPGWFIDSFDVTNIGNSTGTWHHGCYNAAGSACGYSNNADGLLEFPVIDLSTANSTATVSFRADWDLEGSSYDNFWLESSNDNVSWQDITTPQMSYATSWNTPNGIPTDGVIVGGTTYTDETNGWVNLHLDLPANYTGDSTVWIRFRVEADYTVTYGGQQDSKEGLTIDDVRVHEGNTTFHFWDSFNSSSTVTHRGLLNQADDWQYLMLGMGGLTFQYGFEDAPALPPGGWQVANSANQIGWEFGTLATSSAQYPWPSPPSGFATNLGGPYDGSSWNHLYSPSYTIPSGASARLTFDHWICAEYGWDGGAVYISVNNGSWNHFDPGNNWYDNTITNNQNSPVLGLGVFDGNQQGGTSWTTCNTNTSQTWRTQTADLSNYSGSDVKFRFSFTSDTSVNYEGWYLDDIGLEVDWFDSHGEWESPLLTAADLGMGFIDTSAVVPNGTWISGTLLDASGQEVAGFENSTFPISLAGLDLDANSMGVRLRLNMGTNNPILTPLVSQVHVGSLRMMTGVGAESNGWTIPSGMVVNSTGVLTNPTGTTLTITSDFIHSTVPMAGFSMASDASAISVSIVDIYGNSVGAMAPPASTTGLNYPSAGYGVRISVSPSGWIDSLRIEAELLDPALDPQIDVARDGVFDWEFPSTDNQGRMGWQTRIAGDGLANAADTFSESITVPSSGSAETTVLLPADALVQSGIISISPDESEQVDVEVAGATLASLNAGWEKQTLALDNSIITAISALSPTHQDSTGRDWVEVPISFSGNSQTLNLDSVGVGYSLFENVTGLGPVVKAYHEANNDDGALATVEIPLSFISQSGGITIDGGVYHELMITNEPFTVSSTFLPDGTSQGFVTGHHHLYDQSEIAEIHLTGTTSSGDEIKCIVDDLENGGTFTQSSGSEMMALNSSASSAVLFDGSWDVDWQFEISWDWDDEAQVDWASKAFNHSGEGLAPATATSGGSGSQASENDLEIDSWMVVDQNGNELSNSFDPAYPFPLMAESMLDISGTVRFQNTVGTRPLVDDFVVSVNISGVDVVMNSTGPGVWSGQVQAPVSGDVEIIPQIIRVGPIQGAAGAEDVTITTTHTAVLDPDAPSLVSLEVDTSNGRKTADGYTWDPSNSLKLWASFNETTAYSDSMTLHYWREGVDGEGDYQSLDADMPALSKGEWTVSFSGIDVSGMPTNANLSLYMSGMDWAGNPLVGAGGPGIDSDVATLVVATNVDPVLESSDISLDRAGEYLLPGREHTLTMTITEENGLHTLDLIEARLAGSEEETLAVIRIDPRSNTVSSPDDSMLETTGIEVTSDGHSHIIEIGFIISWELAHSDLPEWSLPSILVYDDDLINPIITQPNLGQLRWQLDSELVVQVLMMEDLTPPKSPDGEDVIYVGLGDEIRFSGVVKHLRSGEVANAIGNSSSLSWSFTHGEQPRTVTTMVNSDATWSQAFVLDNRQVDNPRIEFTFALHGLPGEAMDLTDEVVHVVIDSTPPELTFEGLPAVLDSTSLNQQMIKVSVQDDGGMDGSDLTMYWEYRRPTLSGDSSSLQTAPFMVPLEMISKTGDMWIYSDIVDLTNGTILGLQPGDMIFIWIEAEDQAGNPAMGFGTEEDKLSPYLNVRQFILSIPSIGIAMGDGSTPRGGEVVAGDQLSISISLRNVGTRTGNVKVEMFQNLEQGSSWITSPDWSTTVDISEGQLRTLPAFIFETHQSGAQNIYINLTGDFEDWDTSVAPPGCMMVGRTISCDLSLENDMPTVLSQQQADDGGMDGAMIGALFLLVVVVILLVVVIMKKQGESIYDDEEWEDVADEVSETVTYSSDYAVEESIAMAPVQVVSESSASVDEGPPLPESGLPEGWTMDQWKHYGEQWLEKNS